MRLAAGTMTAKSPCIAILMLALVRNLTITLQASAASPGSEQQQQNEQQRQAMGGADAAGSTFIAPEQGIGKR